MSELEQTMQDELAQILAPHCKAWGIEDDLIAGHEMSRAALEFIRDRLERTLSLIPSPVAVSEIANAAG